MLGLLLIYFLGKKFYDLAFDNKRKPWAYAILGIVTYYGSLLLFGFVLGIILALTGNISFIEGHDLLFSLMSIPIGLLSAYILYKVLEKNWKKSPVNHQSELLDEI